MKKDAVCFFAVICTLFLGCTTVPVINSFMDPELSVYEHAVITVHNNLMDVKVDGQYSFSAGGAGRNDLLWENSAMVLLIPGNHTISASYQDITFKETGGRTAKTTSTAGTMTVTFFAESGHVYRLYPEINGSVIKLSVVDETNPLLVWLDDRDEQAHAAGRQAVISKKLASVKPPKKISSQVLFSKNTNAEPTQFEGAWKTADGRLEYTFQGQSFVTQWYSTKGKMQGGQLGIFTLADGAILLEPLQQTGVTSAAWDDMADVDMAEKMSGGYSLLMPSGQMRGNVEFSYSFRSDGTLLLVDKKPAFQRITLIKQEPATSP
jgi:hypothetical protein